MKDEKGDATKVLHIWRIASNTIEHFELSDEFQDGHIDSHCWDDEEPRFIVCQISTSNIASRTLMSIFVAADDDGENLLVQDTISIDADQCLIGVSIPKLAVLDADVKIRWILLQSLASLEEHNDKLTRDALLSFSCHLRRGYVQQAYQVVRFLKRYSTLAKFMKNILLPTEMVLKTEN